MYIHKLRLKTVSHEPYKAVIKTYGSESCSQAKQDT